jgi:hypothetical protein
VLDEEAGRRLVEEPLRGVVFWDELAVDRLLRLTAGHPYFLQAFCWMLVDHCRAEERTFVGPQDVEASIFEVWALTESHLQELWRECTALEQLLLATLVRGSTEGSPVGVAELVTHLAGSHGLSLQRGRVLVALEALTERQVLRRVGEDRYSVLVPLFARWVRETWSASSLAEEVPLRDDP